MPQPSSEHWNQTFEGTIYFPPQKKINKCSATRLPAFPTSRLERNLYPTLFSSTSSGTLFFFQKIVPFNYVYLGNEQFWPHSKSLRTFSLGMGLFGTTNAATRGVAATEEEEEEDATTTLYRWVGTDTSLSPMTFEEKQKF